MTEIGKVAGSVAGPIAEPHKWVEMDKILDGMPFWVKIGI
jgi:hypothetical protein